MRSTPEFATFTGNKDYNDVLENWTEDRFSEDNKTCLAFLERASRLMSTSQNDRDKESLEFFVSELTIFTAGHRHGGFYFPLNYMEGAHVDFSRLAEWAAPATVKDYKDIVQRYIKFPGQVDQFIQTMRSGIEKKMTNNAVSMKGVVDNCRKISAEDPKTSAYFEPFLTIASGSEDDKKSLQAEAELAITNSIKPAFAKLAAFLDKEYLPACRPDIAATSLPNGQDFYSACLAFHTTTSLTAEEIHAMGHKEVERIEEEMREIIKELGHDMSLKDFINKLREDKSNYFSSAEELLASGNDIVFNKIYPRLTQIFTAVPKTKLEINSTPSGDYPAGFYLAGTEDGSRPARYSLNTIKYDSQPKYEMISLSLHEACPGHHLQGSYLLEKDGVPQFR